MGRIGVTQSGHDRRRYLARQPEAAMFAGFKDFALFRIELSAVHLVAGFGRIVDLKPADVLTDISDASALLDAEAGAVEHMNDDHRDALALYATRLLGAPAGDWRCAGLDPEGLELQSGRIALRLSFPQRVTEPGVLRQVLKQLAEAARTAT
jgi:putative heme iron utilization protein